MPTAKGVRDYLVADSLEAVCTLLAHGVVELHLLPWTTDAPGCPDRLIFDLDPGLAVGWTQVVATAQALRVLLGRLGLAAWVATTGGRGLHVLVPLGPEHPARVTFAAARVIAQRLVQEDPLHLTLALPRTARDDRILIDYLRNKRTDSAIGPGSPRARAGAPVAWPWSWEALTEQPPQLSVPQLQQQDLSTAIQSWAGFQAVRQALPEALAAAADALTLGSDGSAPPRR